MSELSATQFPLFHSLVFIRSGDSPVRLIFDGGRGGHLGLPGSWDRLAERPFRSVTEIWLRGTDGWGADGWGAQHI